MGGRDDEPAGSRKASDRLSVDPKMACARQQEVQKPFRAFTYGFLKRYSTALVEVPGIEPGSVQDLLVLLRV